MPGARILLIEDDEVLCNLVKRNLEMRQHEMSIGVDAKSALALLRTHSFDLVLLDINLPDQTGWEILRTARKEDLLHLFVPEGGSDAEVLPVVVLSAVRVSPSRLTEFHPLAYLPKPFPMEALLRLAAEAGERREKNTDHGSKAVETRFHSSPEEELHA